MTLIAAPRILVSQMSRTGTLDGEGDFLLQHRYHLEWSLRSAALADGREDKDEDEEQVVTVDGKKQVILIIHLR